MKIFLCGLPASGKTSFGNEIAETKGYLHIDAEKQTWSDKSLQSAWNEIFNDFSRIDDFVKKTGNQVIFNLGFRTVPASIGFIVGLKSRGYLPVWFEIPIDVARERYKTRNGSITQEFESQIASIENNRKIVDEFINPLRINVLNGTNQKNTDDIYEEIEASYKLIHHA